MRSRKAIRYIVATALLLPIFGFIGWHELFRDNTTPALAAVTQSIAELPESTAPDTPKPPQYYGLKRAEIALNEYRKGITEAPRGCNCGPEIDKYTEGNPGQWCTMFASWVTREAGSPIWSDQVRSWRISNSRMFTELLKQHGTWHSREEIIAKGLTPQLGDFVVYWRGNIEDGLGHVDIVVKNDGPFGTAGLIGGNIKDAVVYRENLPYLNHYGFLGFGRPEKQGVLQ